MIPIMGLIFGILVGIFMPYTIPIKYANYVAVAILAALDSVFGASAASLQGRFDLKIFLTGFFGNALLAAFLAYIGDKLGVQLYLAAVFTFGNRIFSNFALIRRLLITRKSNRKKEKEEAKLVE